jgi:MSHA pilin protein MshD
MYTSCRQRGFTLIELIVFIVIVSVALAGVLTVLNITSRSSADPVIRKQALAVAESILEEVMAQPFTWCDPDDANAATATGYAGCTTVQNTAAGKAGESRGSATTPLDNVFDYNGAAISTNIAGGGSAPYTANVTVAPAALNGVGDASATSAALLITVAVSAGGETIQLQGYRARYVPNLLP